MSAPDLQGNLARMPVADLLSLLEMQRRSGRLEVRRDGLTADLRYADGEMQQARLSDGRRGDAAVDEILSWNDGSFRLHFGAEAADAVAENGANGGETAETPRRPFVSARRRAEVEALFSAPDADEDDPQRYNLHRVLALVNLAASYSASVAEPPIVTGRLQRHRARLLPRHAELAVFDVQDEAAVSVRPGTDPQRLDRRPLETAAQAWISALFDDLEESFPGNFPDDLLDNLVASVEERRAADDAGGWLDALR